MIEIGTSIAGKYRVQRILGHGGMGYVLQAFHEQLGESVAIKFMVPQLARDPDAVARFLREARASFRIRSEHVARVLDVGEHEGSPFIVMELLSGHDLAVEISERFVPSVEAVGFMLQICEALAAAHALGIVHRDLKPSNLFLTRRSDGAALIKVLDFGISKALDDPNAPPADSLTMSHRLLGSPHYMSPEQARSPKAADARSDIWSLGIVLFELVLGQRPFHGDTPVAILASLLSDKLPELTEEQRRLMPDRLMQVIVRCLQREPERRFSDVAEFARALLPMASSHSELAVARIESIAHTIPAVDTPPTEPSPVSPATNGSTLISGRTSLVGATSSTHSLDPQRPPLLRRASWAKALIPLVAVGALVYGLAVSGTLAHRTAGSAAPAPGDQPKKLDPQSQAKDPKAQQLQAPDAGVVVGPAVPPFEALGTASAPASSAQGAGRTNHARKQPSRSPPAAATSASQPNSKVPATPARPPRPTSTADPKNQPD